MNRQQLRAMQETLTVGVARMNAGAARELLVSTARAEQARVIREQTSRGGTPPSLQTIVDNRRGARIEQVRPDGTIVLEWGYVREVAVAALAALIEAGPQDAGDWKRSLVILADNVEVEPTRIPHEARDVKLIAPMPYARRLEIGKTRRGDPFVLENEDYRLVERTSGRLRRLYARVARIGFGYAQLQGAYQTKGRNARDVRFPAVTIEGWQVR